MSIQWMALLGSLTSCCPGQKRKLQFFFLSPDADSPVWGRKTATGLVFHWCPSVPGDGSSAAGLCFLSHSPLSWCPRSPSPLSKFLLLVCPKARGNIWVFGIGVSSMPSVNSSLFCWELETCSNSCVPSLCLLPNPHLLWMSCPSAAVFHCPPPGFHCSPISAAWPCPSSTDSHQPPWFSQGSFLWCIPTLSACSRRLPGAFRPRNSLKSHWRGRHLRRCATFPYFQ